MRNVPAEQQSIPIPDLDEFRIEKFWSKVDVRGLDECWPWKGPFVKTPKIEHSTVPWYGRFSFGRALGRRLAHRVAYRIQFGEDPVGFIVMHSCDNPPCCNGKHLLKGTSSLNGKDMGQKGRASHGDNHYARRTPWLHHPIHVTPEIAARGEANGAAKLTDILALEIRRMYASGNFTQRYLAERYAVSQIVICRLVRGDTWTHVSGPITRKRFRRSFKRVYSGERQ